MKTDKRIGTLLQIILMSCGAFQACYSQIGNVATGHRNTASSLTKQGSTLGVLPAPRISEILDNWLEIGTTDNEITKRLGPPIKGKDTYWGALGTYVQEWKFPSYGISIQMESEEENGAKLVGQAGFKVIHPCKMKTSQNIGIGSPVGEVRKQYKSLIAPESTGESHTIVVGTIYEGTIFTIENDTVSQMFVGGAAE